MDVCTVWKVLLCNLSSSFYCVLLVISPVCFFMIPPLLFCPFPWANGEERGHNEMKEVGRLGLRLEKEEEGEGKEWGVEWGEGELVLAWWKGENARMGERKKKKAMLDWRRTNATSINKRYGSAISAWIWIHNFIRRERRFAEWRKGGMIPAGRLLAWQRLLHFLKLFATGGRKKKIQR